MRQFNRKPKGNKFNARKTLVDGMMFDSQSESEYYLHLKELKKKGEILDFECQVPFLLQDSFKYFDYAKGKEVTARKSEYISDFVVYYPNGDIHIQDVKFIQLDVFKLKKKLLLKILKDKGMNNHYFYCIKKVRNKWVPW